MIMNFSYIFYKYLKLIKNNIYSQILKAKADVNLKHKWGETALHEGFYKF